MICQTEKKKRETNPLLNLLIIIRFFVDVSQSTLSTVLSIKVSSHEDPRPTVGPRALSSQSLDLPAVINLVELEHSQLHFLFLVLDLFGGGVVLLLAFLTTTPQPKNEVKGRLLLDVVVGERAAIFELFPGKDQTLLVRWDTWRSMLPRW